MIKFLLILFFIITRFHVAAQVNPPVSFSTIKINSTFDSSYYLFETKKKNKPILTITGKDITIDFKGSTISGSSNPGAPDKYSGTAIQIKKGKNITIKNLKITGFKNAIDAKNIDGLKFENCEFIDNYRRPIFNYQPFRNNKPGADMDQQAIMQSAVILSGCKNIEITNCKARANENVVLMQHCSNAIVWNNDFSFNSGAAFILRVSNNNQFLYNRFNFNIADTLLSRTASFVVDGASASNIIYKNSITHSVNGIMIGGSRIRKNASRSTRNVIMENDLSYNYLSGITSFNSDALLNKNRIYESGKGGMFFSPQQQFVSNNQFRYNVTGIEIIGNGSSTIHHNIFIEDRVAMRLAYNETRTANLGKGVRAVIVANSFNRNRVVYHIDRVDSIAEFNNLYQQYDTLFKADTSMMNIDVEENEDVLVELSEDFVPVLKEVAFPYNPFKGNGRFSGRSAYVPTTWGPYDYSYPMAFVKNSVDSTIEVQVLGPEGVWEVRDQSGFELVSISGKELPGKLVLKRKEGLNPVLVLAFRPGGAGKDIPVLFSVTGL
jgi:hypothetical protein